ncbi:hypothetical protein [Kribbella sp. NPDC048915]|uniref:hypothetical protein n=1 Tax=Kribbella sp. NPDC048915 TaxID=3155148 RepID=UPI0033E4E634
MAAAVLSSAQNVGAALGLAIMSGFATRATADSLAAGKRLVAASTDGCGRALITGSLFVAAAALVALRTTNARHAVPPTHEPADSTEPA